MTKSKKVTLSAFASIPLDRLELSQANVRQTRAGVGIDQLADDIARRTMLQSLTVRALLDDEGQETGRYHVPAGGRRFRALELLVSQKRLAKDAPIPCVIRTEGLAEEDSLAENVQRAPLHPLDQFRAFQAMRDKGMSEEEIAAAFFVTSSIVKQRLRLAAVASELLDLYAEDALSLDQLMAFTVNPDHQRQLQVWEAIAHSHARQPHEIRRMLTEGAVRASDRRAVFVGVDAYVEVGGAVLRDLFQGDDGGWLQDASLLDLMAAEKLNDVATEVAAEGYKWVKTAFDLPYGHNWGLRQLTGEQPVMTEELTTRRESIVERMAEIERRFAGADELPDDIDETMGSLEAQLEAIDGRPVTYTLEDIATAGAFVSVDAYGALRIERGFVRPEDEAVVEIGVEQADGLVEATGIGDSDSTDGGAVVDNRQPVVDAEEDDGIKPLPDRLLSELTVHRTVALREAIGREYDIAFLAGVHALTLRTFYRWSQSSCLEIEVRNGAFAVQPTGVAETSAARALDDRHKALAEALPEEPSDLWDVLASVDDGFTRALFAHCVSMSVNAVHDQYVRRPNAMEHAEQLAQATGLDMAVAGWVPTCDNYLTRVTKARIVEAVREGVGKHEADGLAGLKKDAMATRAEQLLAGTGWLPEPLRTRGIAPVSATGPVEADGSDETVEPTETDKPEYEPEAIAAQ